MALEVAFLLVFSILCAVQRNECFKVSGTPDIGLANRKPNTLVPASLNKVNTSGKKALAERLEEMGRQLNETNTYLEKQCSRLDGVNSLLFGMLQTDDDQVLEEFLMLKFEDSALSSVYDGNEADRAIDGDTNPNYSGRSCAHSNKESTPWWVGTLSARSEIHKVELTNRQDAEKRRMSNIFVEVFETDPRTDADAEPQLCGKIKMAPQRLVSVECEKPLTGKYLRVIKRKKGYLTLCEVQAYVKPAHKKFGKAIQSSEVAGASFASDVDEATCSETEDDQDMETWWQVDMSDDRTVTAVNITNRKDEKYPFLSDFKVSVHKTFPSVCEDSDDNVCTHHKGTVGQGETVTLTCDRPMTGRFLRITKVNGGMLSLCNVIVL